MMQQAIEVEHRGQMIRGMSYRPEGKARVPAVLFLHGFTGQRIETSFVFVQLARALAQRGIAAVTFDFINSGESDGSFDKMLVTQELADALRMTQWLTGQPFVDRSRMGLLGFSLGGLVAASAMARTDVYSALALMAPTTVENLCRHANRERIEGKVVVGPYLLHEDFFDDARTLNPVADIIVNPRPTLLVQGTGDSGVVEDRRVLRLG